MEHCSNCDIVFDVRSGCPLCDAQELIHELEKQIEILEMDIADLTKGER